MRCSSCEPLLDRYIEGTLPPLKMRAMREHVQACSACAALLDELRVVDALLATTRDAELAPNFTFAVMAEVRTTPRFVRRTMPLWGYLSIYLASAWIVLCAIALALRGNLGWASPFASAVRADIANAVGALGGVVHSLGGGTPIAVAVTSGILAVDAVLAVGFIYAYRTLHPRLAAHLASREVS